MSWQDIINGAYELFAGVAILGHCVTLYRDKQLRGVSVISTVFFTSWGFWNLYYYPHLNQWMSFAGGLSIVAANCVWLSMMFYYSEGAKRWRLVRDLTRADLNAKRAESMTIAAMTAVATEPYDADEPHCNLSGCHLTKGEFSAKWGTGPSAGPPG